MKNVIRAACLAIPLGLGVATSAQAECEERVEKVRDEIQRDRDKYTRESRVEANKHLMRANLPSLSPLQCTEQIAKARRALREGRQ